MICSKCGCETGNNSSMCKMCAAGAPRTYGARAATPGFPAQTQQYTAPAAPPPPPPPSPSPSYQSSPQPTKPAPAPKPVKQPKIRSDSDEMNIFALLGISHAFFCPILGLILSVMGLAKADEYGGRTASIIGIVVGAVLTITIIVLLVVVLMSDVVGIQFIIR